MTMSIKSNNHHFEAYRVRNYPGIHGDLIGYNLIPGPSIVQELLNLLVLGQLYLQKFKFGSTGAKRPKSSNSSILINSWLILVKINLNQVCILPPQKNDFMLNINKLFP